MVLASCHTYSTQSVYQSFHISALKDHCLIIANMLILAFLQFYFSHTDPVIFTNVATTLFLVCFCSLYSQLNVFWSFFVTVCILLYLTDVLLAQMLIIDVLTQYFSQPAGGAPLFVECSLADYITFMFQISCWPSWDWYWHPLHLLDILQCVSFTFWQSCKACLWSKGLVGVEIISLQLVISVW